MTQIQTNKKLTTLAITKSVNIVTLTDGMCTTVKTTYLKNNTTVIKACVNIP